MTWKRLTLAGALIVALTAGATAAGATVIPALAGPAPQQPAEHPPVSDAPIEPSETPSASASPSPSASPTGVVRPSAAFAGWAENLSGKVDIPKTALEAYGYAEWVLQQTRSTCKLQWTTLAAIGKISTDHGRHGGGTLDAQGRAKPNIIGPVMTGADTDGGALDGSSAKDHPVGPMQLSPVMWRSYGVDGDSNELADPQDIDDSALSAGYHLCAVAADLSIVANWKVAVSDYHGMKQHLDKIFEVAQTYGTKSRE